MRDGVGMRACGHAGRCGAGTRSCVTSGPADERACGRAGLRACGVSGGGVSERGAQRKYDAPLRSSTVPEAHTAVGEVR